jgi:hypothetical protein
MKDASRTHTITEVTDETILEGSRRIYASRITVTL